MKWGSEDSEETKTLVRMYADHSAAEIAKAIGGCCTKLAVQKKAQKMRLSKSAEFCATHCINLSPREKAKASGIDKNQPGIIIHRIM